MKIKNYLDEETFKNELKDMDKQKYKKLQEGFYNISDGLSKVEEILPDLESADAKKALSTIKQIHSLFNKCRITSYIL